jgi:hypothetical protein
VEVFALPDPKPEDRDYYWEFRDREAGGIDRINGINRMANTENREPTETIIVCAIKVHLTLGQYTNHECT